jgi:hypothetical protein
MIEIFHMIMVFLPYLFMGYHTFMAVRVREYDRPEYVHLLWVIVFLLIVISDGITK